MKRDSEVWTTVTPSQYPWEQAALDHLRSALPDHGPYRVWSNFELTAEDGSINEIDALVMTPQGLFLMEIKSHRGALSGDAGHWTLQFEGKTRTISHPRLLTNRKAKRLKARLDRTKAARKRKLPFVEAVVFLSSTNLNPGGLDAVARQGVFSRRDSEKPTPIPGLEPLWSWTPRSGPRLGEATARQLDRAMDEIGIRPSQSLRRVGDYDLVELIEEGSGWQDWRARHRSLALRRRLRLYHTLAARGTETHDTLLRAAKREVMMLQGIDHPGIVRAYDHLEHELGPVVLFEDHSGAVRLDHWLSERLDTLTFDQRFHLLRQLVEIVDFAHGRRVYHRALGPHCVLVLDPAAVEPKLAVMSWHTGSRTGGSTHGPRLTGQTAMRPTLHPDRLLEQGAEVYVAPEVRTHLNPSAVKADVFSLGVVAYHLFAGQPPAADPLELQHRLFEERGLALSATTDGVSPSLARLILEATHPEPERRAHDTRHLLDLLDELEDELTTPDHPVVELELVRGGDVLPGGWEVVKRLGQGSTAFVFLVRRQGREQVLKVARSVEQNRFLDDEAEVLDRLRHDGIIELYERVEVGDRTALAMARAGNRTLAERLRSDRSLSLEFLERFGQDLLRTVQWLEEQGISHRDIKPDNLGIQAAGKNDVRHLVLFDFSLSRAPADRCDLGTPPYLDPFLRHPARSRWDLAAERYSAAMTLHEMVTGQLPQWGDGKGDALYAEEEIRIDPEGFVPVVRQGLTDFFRRALRREASRRFDNAEQMLRAWMRVFLEAERPTLPTPHPTDHDASPLDAIAPDTPVVDLGLSSRAFHALETLGIHDVASLVRTRMVRVRSLRGVGAKTHRELRETQEALRRRFPELLGDEEPSTPLPIPEGKGGHAAGGAHPPSDEAPLPRAVDRIAEALLPKGSGAREGRYGPALRLFLGLDGDDFPTGDFPTGDGSPRPNQSQVADALGITRAAVSQYLKKARRRWAKTRALTAVRDDIATLLELRGGAMGELEVARALLTDRGARATGEARLRAALAIVRAADEVERTLAHPRWLQRRAPATSLLVRIGTPGAEAAAQAQAHWALKLGGIADRLADLDPLPAPGVALDRLLELPPPEGSPPLPSPRLVRLAAACSRRAAVSSRAELYPRGLPAARALGLAAGVAQGVHGITDVELRERVRSRYPEAEPLPERPALDHLLAEAGIELHWDAAEGAYVPPDRFSLLSSTGTWSQVLSSSPRPAPDEETLAAQDFEQRLRRADTQGSWLALLTLPQLTQRTAERLRERFPELVPLSGDRLLIGALRRAADRLGVAWSVVLEADAAEPGSGDWRNLQRLVEHALGEVETELLDQPGTVLLSEAGLFGRYDRLDLLEGLRERLASPEEGRALRGLWLLVPGDQQSDAPRLAGRALPVIGPGDWARVPESWVSGAHLV